MTTVPRRQIVEMARAECGMIVCAGEALVDLLPVADCEGGAAFRAAIGGSPFNVAVALGRLGVPSAFLGALSNDAFGGRIWATLQESGADMRLITRVERPTPLDW